MSTNVMELVTAGPDWMNATAVSRVKLFLESSSELQNNNNNNNNNVRKDYKRCQYGTITASNRRPD